ncbi:ABC transporter ATP-binding protein [Thermaerobacter subterraneus]|uniref:Oligopeptide/dipeptide ABC transporter, ATP-binding protein n=1 Tax=Thermaerobacter subterraneus DSM 13965 TaxID=867903 RepID=K6NZ41_9FIRM|nr:ABC transporter ATP-binding protein [Thermaerobacter subterraneus]EKP94130.1 oligopeptide/dipeptide ABC transporter, ATP-binding protein [Thermaerobacter subterraneus DSM 13965]
MVVLEVRGLEVTFPTPAGPARAVGGIDFDLYAGEVLGLVGESGSGKSVTALALMGLLPPGAQVRGEVLLNGKNLLAQPESHWRRVRGQEMAMIFQEPMTSLNPVMTVGAQIAEALILHGTPAGAARRRAVELLERAGIPEPERRALQYPHQLSGGMRQRVMIAMAMACRPRVLIADEPTTALDVTVQAQILDLMKALQEETGTAILLITHDLGVVAEMCHRVAVMYAGRIVEKATVADLFDRPGHPYTEGLLQSLPLAAAPKTPLRAMAGAVPHPAQLPPGCAFAPRCPYAVERCHREVPVLAGGVACHRAGELRLEGVVPEGAAAGTGGDCLWDGLAAGEGADGGFSASAPRGPAATPDGGGHR